MSFLDVLWFAIVLVSFIVLVFSACTADPRSEHYDTPCFRNIAIGITGFILLLYYLNWAQPAPVTVKYGGHNPVFTIWNRSTRYNKGGWQVTDYRKPSKHLSPPDYMMGVELAKSNACHYFNFSRDTDIDNFRRCAHFFPEFLDIYRSQYEARVGVCI